MKFSKELLAKLGVKVKTKTPSVRRSLGGVEARRQGKVFEQRLELYARAQKVEVVRLPDGCKQVGPKGIVRVKSPFDFILGFNGSTAMIDTKSTGESTLTLKEMPAHQVNAMLKLAKHSRAGFLVWFRRYDTVNFFDINTMIRLGKMRFDSGQPIGPGTKFDLKKIF